MFRRWIRTTSARIGIRLRFTGVICVHATQSVSIDAEGHPEINFRKLLVFLEPPSAGDLRDVYALGASQPTSGTIYTSPDAVEVSREEPEPGRLIISWLPRDPIVVNALYEHQYGWRPAAKFDDAAVGVEYDCNMRTGIVTIELASARKFDAAVLFERPRWPLRLTERHIVRAALRRLKEPEPAPRIINEGTRIIGEVEAPRVGSRYLLVAFGPCGIADCEEWLARTSLLNRCQRTVTEWAHALTG
jgi:hypothetical protein